jgi:hypothetical protein
MISVIVYNFQTKCKPTKSQNDATCCACQIFILFMGHPVPMIADTKRKLVEVKFPKPPGLGIRVTQGFASN